jgi:hypothetical protein
MIDLLIKWPDSPTAIACGQALGCTAASESDPEVMVTASRFGVINLAVIGQHSHISDNSDPENPIVNTVPGHWVLVRVPAGFDIAEALSPIPVELQPEIVWSSDMADENGDPVPRPQIEEASQLRWA